ncbi:MAG: hypothetical protein HYT08_05135 [Candidatus Levybacteria bacterium]|nr:hypothetical protein [Candidatus Levybacteria bacterium]
MEENTAQNLPSEAPQVKRFFGLGSDSAKWILIFFLVVFSLAGGIFIKSQNDKANNPPQQQDDKNKTQTAYIAPVSFIYGSWSKDKSTISVLDLSTSQSGILVELPSNVKHVKILDSKRISYIKDTDANDYGKQVVIRAFDTKTETTVITADSGYGIDDYVVSPNSKYLAVWEVSPSEGGALFGGKSRVYTLDTSNPAQKNLIYDETSGLGVTLAYPIAITDSGDLFTDKFLPNSGAGWGYGVSVSNFTGTNKQDIPSLTNGMISTQPEVSPDGKKLLFAGYDGRKGSGTSETDGFRRAILSSNTLEIFDLATRQKKTLLATSNDDIFSDPNWDRLTGNIVYRLISKNDSLSGTYFYNVSTNNSQKINLDNIATGTKLTDILTLVSENKYLAVDKTTSDSELGNLGGKYSQLINSMYLLDIPAQSRTTVNLDKGLVQMIDLKPQGYFSSKLLSLGTDQLRNQIQLQTFELKPSLAPKRLVQQSDPVPPQPAPSSAPKHVINPNACYARAAAQCNEILGKDYPLDIMKNRVWDPDYPEDPEFQQCFHDAWIDLAGSCSDSPLYLYGQEGKSVSVYSTTAIYPLNTNYSPALGLNVILNGDGTFTSGNERVSSFKFDYEPAINVDKPVKGYVVRKEKVQDLIEQISSRLGLNEKESADTLEFVKTRAVSSYIFISLFDDATSKKILPLVIAPSPDTYRNIVFYIENLDNSPSYSYIPPVIEKIERKGFTAVEISFMVR